MEKDRGSWFPQHHIEWQSPKLNSLSDLLDLRPPNSISMCMNSHANVVSRNGNLLVDAFSEPPRMWPGQVNEPQGWFHCLPCSRQASVLAQNSVIQEKFSTSSPKDLREAMAPNASSKPAQKRFLVFDQSGDQTTLIFSSVIGAPVQPPTSCGPKPSAYNWTGEEPETKRDPIYHSGPIVTDEFNEPHGADAGSELHEDTEELNALLYSDDDGDDTEDNEETSTGHSPSIMAAHNNQEWLGDNIEEVASSDEVIKRQKLGYGSYNVPSLIDTASSVNQNRFLHLDNDAESDAESSCANCLKTQFEGRGFLSGSKRTRKEKIRETVSILQSIVPGGKGKDAIVVLDESIHYLKSLKLKAKALGIDTL
ncbi:transcription factor bHLH145-like isoform X1 [Malania oleifera]|nr:transcription factor bHLH145-like isoform X1 [Malania oleifera]XP_057973865.1 transcription factor bHLH145-like isoform X1 [Malania oleifera]